MKLSTITEHRAFPIIFWTILGLIVCLRIYPAVVLPPHGDEGADLTALTRDYLSLPKFFDPKISIAADQSRLSHLIAAIVIGMVGIDNIGLYKNLGVLRLVFLLIHVVYLAVSYRFIADVLKSRSAAYMYVFFLGASCYLASYSPAVMTTGESVYMLFHLLAIWVFYVNFQNSLSGGHFNQFSLLCLTIACAIASKLFGLLLLIAFFCFHFFNLSQTRTLLIPMPLPKHILGIGLAFLSFIVAVNLSPFSYMIKTILVLSIGFLYVLVWIGMAYLEKKGRFAPVKIHFIHFWCLLTFCCFTLVLVLSPIYLNLQNFFDVFNWFNTWGGAKINSVSSKSDAVMILLLKFGIIPSILLGIVIILGVGLVVKMPGKPLRNITKSIYFLLFLIFFLNLFLISIVHLKLPWHGISIFPFLYLPFVALFAYAKSRNYLRLSHLMIAALIIVSADNLYRYISWFPYGHFDGGQYGKAHIGLNKPCLISFEAVPIFYDYFSSLDRRDGKIYDSVNVMGVNVKILNDYLIQMLKYYFSVKNRKDVFFTSKDLANNYSDLILSSPIFTPEVEAVLRAKEYHKLGTISIHNITVASVWKGKAG